VYNSTSATGDITEELNGEQNCQEIEIVIAILLTNRASSGEELILPMWPRLEVRRCHHRSYYSWYTQRTFRSQANV